MKDKKIDLSKEMLKHLDDNKIKYEIVKEKENANDKI